MTDIETQALRHAVKAILADLYSRKAGQTRVESYMVLLDAVQGLRLRGDNRSLAIASEIESLQPPPCSGFAPL